MAAEWKTEAHESPEVRTKRVLALVFGFVAFVTLLFGGLNAYYEIILRNRVVETSLRDFPAPRLQPNPTQDYFNFRAAQIQALEGQDKRADHLPIEQAMAIVVARGAKAYDPVEGTPPAGPLLATGAPLDGAPRAAVSPGVAPYGAGQ